MKKALKIAAETNPKIAQMIPHLKGKICLVFTNGSLKDVRDVLNQNKKEAAAKAGQIAQNKIVVPAQNTGQEPTKTSFFQVLNIQTRITKGSVEIVQDTTILEKGQKVGNSEAALLAMLNMKPFVYGLSVTQCYDEGSCFSSAVLDTSADDMMKVLQEAVSNVAALSLGTCFPTEASMPSLLTNAFKDILAISVATSVPFKESEMMIEAVKNPGKFATAAPAKEEKKPEPKKEEKKPEPKKEEPKPESAGEIGFGLFGGGDDE